MPITIQEHKLGFDPVLSANSSFCETDYTNDQSWDVCIDPKQPSGFVLETSYGLQARIAQVFPVFLDANNLPITDPHPKFNLIKILPEQVQYQVILFPDMDVCMTIRVPNSHTIMSEIEFKCKSSSEKKIQTGVLMRLGPIENGQIMTPQQYQNQTILVGESGSIHPVLMTNGLPRLIHRPHPGLSMQMLVSSNHPATFRWVLSSEKNSVESIEKASVALKLFWPVVFKKAEIFSNNHIVQIHTESPEVDEALYLSQIQSQRLILTRTEKLPFSTLVTSRQPDQGFSPRGDGNDYDPDWHGPSAWDLYHSIRNLFLPAFPEISAGMFHNFIQMQQGYGDIDLRPGLGGQRSRQLAPPILASCCMEIYGYTKNTRRLAEAYPILDYFFKKWLDPEHDRDQDHLPEWNHPIQSGWEVNPLMDPWQDASKGYASETIESPATGALMYRECLSLQEIAKILGKDEDLHRFEQESALIKEEVEKTWDKRRKLYRYRDRDTHLTPTGGTITRGSGSGTFTIDRSFDHPVRICLSMRSPLESTRPISVQFIGLDNKGDHLVEQILQQKIHWREGRAILTARQVLTRLEAISLTGLMPKDEWILTETDLSQIDLSLFLPLWAGIPTNENAARLVSFNLFPNWIEPNKFGLPFINQSGIKNKLSDENQRVSIDKLCMIIDGLLDFGFHTEANKLVNELMEAIINISKSNGHFTESFHAGNGNGLGKINHLLGLPPVGLFLRNLGIKIISADEITVWGKCPSHQEAEIQYQGTRIIRSEQETEIFFQDGQRMHLDGIGKQTIHWKTSGGGK